MKTVMSLVFALAVVGLSGSAFAADAAADPFRSYVEKAAPIKQQLYAKQGELAAVYAAPQPDTAKIQQLFQEIGALRGRLFALRAEIDAQAGAQGGYPAPYGAYGMPCGNDGMGGGFGCGGYGMGGGRGGRGGWGHRGGMGGGHCW